MRQQVESKARPFAAASSYLGKRVGGGGSPAIRRDGHGNATVPGSGTKSGDAEGSGRGDTTAQAEKRGPRGTSGGEDRAPGGHGGSWSRRDEASSGRWKAEWSGSARQVSEQSGVVRVMKSGAGRGGQVVPAKEASGRGRGWNGRKRTTAGLTWKGVGVASGFVLLRRRSV